MPIELIVPPMGESITEVQIGAWRKQPGDPVKRDESVVELESDKATVDLPAPIAGAITKVLKKEGERAHVVSKRGEIDEKLCSGRSRTEPVLRRRLPALVIDDHEAPIARRVDTIHPQRETRGTERDLPLFFQRFDPERRTRSLEFREGNNELRDAPLFTLA